MTIKKAKVQTEKLVFSHDQKLVKQVTNRAGGNS